MMYHLFLSKAAVNLLGNEAFAGTMGPVEHPKNWAWVGSISAGAVWSRGWDTQTFYLTPEIEEIYAARKSTHSIATGELFVGLQKTPTPQWLGQLGLSMTTFSNAQLQGVILNDADPQFDNHHYQYKVRNTRVAIKGKLLLDKSYWLMPWVSESLGVGFNRTYDFTNTPLIFEALPNPNFASHTKSAFTYTLDTGVQKTINEYWQVGIDYEFADWDKSRLGHAAEQTLDSGLALNHSYMNGVLLNLTYAA